MFEPNCEGGIGSAKLAAAASHVEMFPQSSAAVFSELSPFNAHNGFIRDLKENGKSQKNIQLPFKLNLMFLQHCKQKRLGNPM